VNHRHSRSTFDVPTNSQATVMIDQNDRIRTRCDDVSLEIPVMRPRRPDILLVL
jgi:hypothetical protein